MVAFSRTERQARGDSGRVVALLPHVHHAFRYTDLGYGLCKVPHSDWDYHCFGHLQKRCTTREEVDCFVWSCHSAMRRRSQAEAVTVAEFGRPNRMAVGTVDGLLTWTAVQGFAAGSKGIWDHWRY